MCVPHSMDKNVSGNRKFFSLDNKIQLKSPPMTTVSATSVPNIAEIHFLTGVLFSGDVCSRHPTALLQEK